MADLFSKSSCTYCEEIITSIKIRCCVCPDFDICCQCFASGAEIGTHKNNHDYTFVEHWTVNLFGGKGSWTGGEELQLLEGVELYGFGNWELISQHIGTRSPEEVKDEYVSRYLDGNIGKATWVEPKTSESMLIDNVPEDNGPLSPFVISQLPPIDVTPEEAQQLGYKPHRDDFIWEYDMPAEGLVSSLQVDSAEDTDIEVALKLSMIDMYTRKLRERVKRKRLVRDYQLVGKFFANQRKDANKLLTKDQKDLRESMKVFSQFQTSGEHERLISNVEREKELRHRLSELLRYRSLGITTQEDVHHYEQHVAHQNQQQMKQNKSGSSGFPISIQEVQTKNGKSEGSPNLYEKRYTCPQFVGQENNNYNSLSMDNLLESKSNIITIESLLSEQE